MRPFSRAARAIERSNTEGRQGPLLDRLGFDHRLMTPGRLLELAGGWPVGFDWTPADGLFLTCLQCGRSVTRLGAVPGGSYRGTLTQLLADVLRHRVTAHDLTLSGGGTSG